MYDWPATVGVILVLLAAASFAMLRMLLIIFGRRPGILIPLGIFLFCPLTLAGTDWWAVAIEILPLEAAIFMAVGTHVRYLRSGRLRTAVAAAAWLAVGMAAMEKGAVVPLLLLALTAAYFVPRVRDVGRYWRAWAIYGGVLACYVTIFFVQLHTSAVQPGDPGSAGHVFSLISTMVGTSLVPGALGGPWHWVSGSGYDQAAPPAVLQVISWAVALIVVAATCLWRARAWRAWAILAGWIATADFVPVIIGRLAGFPGTVLGAQTRYLTDATAVLALCAGLALLPLAGEQDASRSAAWPARAGPAAPSADRRGHGPDLRGGGRVGVVTGTAGDRQQRHHRHRPVVHRDRPGRGRGRAAGHGDRGYGRARGHHGRRPVLEPRADLGRDRRS